MGFHIHKITHSISHAVKSAAKLPEKTVKETKRTVKKTGKLVEKADKEVKLATKKTVKTTKKALEKAGKKTIKTTKKTIKKAAKASKKAIKTTKKTVKKVAKATEKAVSKTSKKIGLTDHPFRAIGTVIDVITGCPITGHILGALADKALLNKDSTALKYTKKTAKTAEKTVKITGKYIANHPLQVGGTIIGAFFGCPQVGQILGAISDKAILNKDSMTVDLLRCKENPKNNPFRDIGYGVGLYFGGDIGAEIGSLTGAAIDKGVFNSNSEEFDSIKDIGNGHVFRGVGQIIGQAYGDGDVGRTVGALADKGLRNKNSIESDHPEYVFGDKLLSSAGTYTSNKINGN